MKVSTIRSPSAVNICSLIIETQLADFRRQLYKNTTHPNGRKDAEHFIFLCRGALTSWRDQLNKILEYIEQDLTPE